VVPAETFSESFGLCAIERRHTTRHVAAIGTITVVAATDPEDLAVTPWTQLSRRTVYENPWIRVEEDLVRVPGGHETIYGVVRCRDAVGVLPFVDDDHVLLVQQYRYVAGHATWEMPTGGRAANESREQAARRELIEEAGFDAAQLEPLTRFHTSKSVVDETAHLYLARDLTPAEPPGRRNRAVPPQGVAVRRGRVDGAPRCDHRFDDGHRRAAGRRATPWMTGWTAC
jgi:ADP-ribose pyrophosphatase